MIENVLGDLAQVMSTHGFRDVAEPDRTIPGALLLLKRQTFNTNRAVVVVTLPEAPLDLRAHLRDLQGRVAKRCGFIPFLWGIGIQVVAISDAASAPDPKGHVAKVDNQWAIIQSLFVVDVPRRQFREERTWGQVITGKFQDAISGVLARHYAKA